MFQLSNIIIFSSLVWAYNFNLYSLGTPYCRRPLDDLSNFEVSFFFLAFKLVNGRLQLAFNRLLPECFELQTARKIG